jgi:hypothetical protein
MATWTIIDETVVGSGGISAWEVTDIPDTYGALWCEVSGRGVANTTYGNFFLRLTSGSGSSPTWDTGNNYCNAVISTAGGITTSASFYAYRATVPYHLMYAPGGSTNSTSHKSNSFFVIPGYADASKYKSILGQSHVEDTGSMPMFNVVATWAETSALKGIRIYNWSGNIAEYSVLTLYGLETQIGN